MNSFPTQLLLSIISLVSSPMPPSGFVPLSFMPISVISMLLILSRSLTRNNPLFTSVSASALFFSSNGPTFPSSAFAMLSSNFLCGYSVPPAATLSPVLVSFA